MPIDYEAEYKLPSRLKQRTGNDEDLVLVGPQPLDAIVGRPIGGSSRVTTYKLVLTSSGLEKSRNGIQTTEMKEGIDYHRK